MENNIIIILVGFVCTILGAILSYLGYRRNVDNDNKTDTARIVRMDVKLDNISRNTDETRLEIKDISKNVQQLTERVTIVEQSVKSAHKRLDNFEDKERRK